MAENSNTAQAAVDATSGMSITVDIADVIGAVIWPLLILIVILLSRRHLPTFLGNFPKIFDRVQKISFGNFSLELAKVAAIAPQWTPTDNALDIRKSMSSAEVTDSTAGHFTNQLTDTAPADFALVDLGEGREWLSSRLYIISVLLERAKDIRTFVFVRTTGSRTRKLVGWAEPEAIRWSLARRFPWLEAAYARSYALLFPAPPAQGDVQIVSATGMLGKAQQGPAPYLLIQLMETFLREIQSPVMPIPEEEDEWVQIQAATPTWEHACWLTADETEDILGEDLYKQYVQSSDLDGKTGTEQAKRLMQVNQRYVPIADDSGRFRELIDRQVVVDRIATELARTP